MTSSVELQIISRILTSDSQGEIDRLCAFDNSYYAVFQKQIDYILDHRSKYGTIPDVFTFQSEFPDFVVLKVDEPLSYLEDMMRKNKQRILLIETFNQLSDLGSADVSEAWEYLSNQVNKSEQLDSSQPMNIISDAEKRAQQIIDYNKQTRIPTGFPEIDQCMYGGLSTVEELLVIIARTNAGKSWVCTRMMESAQRNGFPTLYYSPEMQSCFIGTRFDTWRNHFKNSDLYRGVYSEEYKEYLKSLSSEEVGAFVVEDKDMPDGRTTVHGLETLVKKHHIKLLIIDGLSYISDGSKNTIDTIRYKNICTDLFRLSKTYSCAVVIAMQANRETKDQKDDKGDPMPTIYNAEGSDHPGRIATQVFTMRQVFEKHTLDIRLEKTRTAANTKPMFSYNWDPNTGTATYVPVGELNESPVDNQKSFTGVSPSAVLPNIKSAIGPPNIEDFDEYGDDDSDVTF